jgi:hypothetical protein
MVAGITRRFRRRALASVGAVLLLLSATGIACAQDAGQAPTSAAAEPASSRQPTGRRLLLIVTQADGAGYTADTLALLTRAILMGLQLDPRVQATGTVIVDAPGSVPATEDARSQAAGEVGAEGWLWIEVSAGTDGTPLHVRTFDTASQGQGVDETVTMGSSLAVSDLATADWSGLAGLVARAYPSRQGQDAVAAGPTSATLSIHGRPRSRVTVAGGPTVTLDSNGNGSMTLDTPASYTIRATDFGYTPASQSLFLASDREVTVSQAPAARWAVEASLSDGSWPGAAFSWFMIPDILSVGLDISTYFFGLALNEQQVFWSLPLSNLGLRLGVYFAPPDSGFRTYSSLVVFTRVIHAAQYLGLDPLSPLAGRLALGAEIGRGPRGGFFLEYDPVLYLTNLPNLFRASLGPESTPPGWVFAPGVALDLLSIRVGYRWTL